MPQPLHHPPHIYLDDTWYMITSSIYRGRRLLRPDGYKEVVRDQLRAMVLKFGCRLAAWVILDNHYHMLIKSRVGTELTQFVRRLHGRTSHDLNERDGTRGRQMWHNFWDTCMRTEADYWTRFNYIHHNPVKHGYVRRMEDWPFSSYRYYLEHKGEEWLADTFRRYPVIDYSDTDDAAEFDTASSDAGDSATAPSDSRSGDSATAPSDSSSGNSATASPDSRLLPDSEKAISSSPNRAAARHTSR